MMDHYWKSIFKSDYHFRLKIQFTVDRKYFAKQQNSSINVQIKINF